MQELRSGLWTWTAPHPDWTPEQGGPDGWERDVRSYAYDSGGCLVLFDPLAPPTLTEGLIDAQDVAVLLTCEWHRRSADECVERFGAHVCDGWAGGDLPGGVESKATGLSDEVVFWVPAIGALVAGDVLLGHDDSIRVKPDGWLGEGETHESVRAALRPLLELPVELLLPTHGDAVYADARASLAAALET